MDFSFSELQQILSNTARSFLEKEAKDLARNLEKTEEGHSPELWQKMADLGWMGLPFPEEYGGSEGSTLDLVILLGEMGRALVPGPFIPTLLSGLAILGYGSEAQKKALLPEIIGGGKIITPALMRPAGPAASIQVEEEVAVEAGDYVLSGARLFVPYAHVADGFLYRAETAAGPVLFSIDAKSPGIKPSVLPTIAADKQCELALEGVRVPEAMILGDREKGAEAIEQIQEWGALFESGFIVGLLEKVLEMSVEHAKQREQFGALIGSFQAIQHQCADMATEIDKVKFLTYQAAWNLSEGLPASKEIAMAKARASDASRRVCLLGIKVHGGIGISEEYDMQIYFRRAKAAEIAFGDGNFHREMVAEQIGL